MVRTSMIALAACLTGAAPASAQVHDGIDNSPSQQRIADEFRDAGSKCGAPACHRDPDGIDPPSARPGEGGGPPSTPAGQTRPGN